MNAPATRPATGGLAAGPLILVGLPGSGKTTVARLLSARLGVQATDLDAEIRRRTRLTIPQIFDREGEEGFRRHETRTLRHVLTSPAGAQGVVALGGGAVLAQENRDLLHGHTVVYLHTEPALAAEHVGDGQGRPLMSHQGAGGQSDDAVLSRMETLYAQRAHLYEEVATLVIETQACTPEEITDQIIQALGHARLETCEDSSDRPTTPDEPSFHPTDLPPIAQQFGAQGSAPGVCGGNYRVTVAVSQPYDVVIGYGLAGDLLAAISGAPGGGAGGIALVYADAVTEMARAYETLLRQHGYRVSAIEVPGGEASKSASQIARLWDAFSDAGVGRDGLVIGVGGGATTDLVGFAAATWLRGVPVIQVPTTLLAMVDAAVGGKTGIDIAAGKNLVGAFHSPSAVICDLDALATLPAIELRAGMGEVIKCGFIADPVIVDRVLADPPSAADMSAQHPVTVGSLAWDSPMLAELIARSVAVKAAVVGQDLTESGLREILNYGHTYAHAIETLTHYHWRHGEAVAVGCVFAAHVAAHAGLIDRDLLALHRQAFSAVGLPVSFPEGAGSFEDMMQIMGRDKKVRGGNIRMVLLEGMANPRWGLLPERDGLAAAHESVTERQGL